MSIYGCSTNSKTFTQLHVDSNHTKLWNEAPRRPQLRHFALAARRGAAPLRGCTTWCGGHARPPVHKPPPTPRLLSTTDTDRMIHPPPPCWFPKHGELTVGPESTWSTHVVGPRRRPRAGFRRTNRSPRVSLTRFHVGGGRRAPPLPKNAHKFTQISQDYWDVTQGVAKRL